MQSRDSYEWSLRHLGEMPQYPTHPVVMAAMIMARYASLEDASRTDEGEKSPRALTDSFLPGSGCAVWAGLDFLTQAGDGEKQTLWQAIERADSYWRNWEGQAPGNADKGRIGRSQVERLMAHVEERLPSWKAGVMTESDYRLSAGEKVPV